MNIKVGFNPFNDYWQNCFYNMMYSILISTETSYNLAAYLNDYSYNIECGKTNSKKKYNRIKLRSMKSFNFDFVHKKTPLNIKNKNNFIDLIKQKIINKRIITLGVDLFYWIPNSICWEKHHWEHYSLINGFNDNKKVFYVFDENYNGYDEYEIPEERFCTAITNSTLEPFGYEYKLLDTISPYKFSISDVVDNSFYLIDELKNINFDLLWHLRNEDYEAQDSLDLNAMYIYQIENRHKANQLLFDKLYELNEIDNIQLKNKLIKYSQELQKSWAFVKNKLIKTYYSKNPHLGIKKLSYKCKCLFEKESEMWKIFLSYMS